MPTKLTDTKRAEILDDIRATGGTLEGSTRQIADRHDVSDTTVRRIAKDAALVDVWSRANTENATRASEADSAARRAEIASGLLDDVAYFRGLFRQEWRKTVVVPGIGPEQVEADSAEIATGLQKLMTSVGIALDKHTLLDKHDRDDSGGAAVDAWLRDIMGGGRTPTD